LRAHGRCGASATPLKFSPARPEQAGKKEKGFRSTSPQGIFARLLSCEAGLRISARRLRRRVVRILHPDSA